MTALPLPKSRIDNASRNLTGTGSLADKAKQANRGLVFNKFVDRWSEKGDKYDLHTAKKDWLDCFAGNRNKAGDRAALDRARGRVDAIATRTLRTCHPGRYGGGEPLQAAESPRDFLAVSRLATGLGLTHPVENGFLWHHTLGVPYLPGSSVKGMIRAWASHWGGVASNSWANDWTEAQLGECVTRLFGNERDEPAQMGALIVFDALPLAPVEMVVEVLTPHDGGWRLKGPVPIPNDPAGPLLSPGDWHSPVPVYYLAVEEGAAFHFALGATRKAHDGDPETDRPSDVALGYKLLAEALEWTGSGAKTAVGMGRFLPDDKLLPEQLRKLREARSRLSAGVRVRIAEAVSNNKWRGAEATVVKSSPSDPTLWGVVRGQWDGKSPAQVYFKEDEMEVAANP